MIRYCLLFLCFLILSLTACLHDNAIVDEYEKIPDHNWTYTNKPNIQVKIENVAQPYDVFINLRHTDNYKYSNIYLTVQVRTPDHQQSKERIELHLAEPDGHWLGTGSGDLHAHRIPYKTRYRFPKAGTYVFEISQEMRDNPLLNVVDVGIRIVPSGQ